MTTETKSHRVHIDDLHFEHQQWVKELKFYKDELPIFQNRMDSIGKRYTNKDVLKELDHFQNQIYIQGNAMDELIHDINQHEAKIAGYAKEHPVAIDHVLFQDHEPLRERFETNRKIIQDLKSEFYRYLAKWM